MKETGNMFTGEEYHARLGIFLQNKRLVQEHNAGKFAYTVALNKLAHLTPAEYSALLGFKMAYNPNMGKVTQTHYVADDSCDWRDKGAVNAIKDQGQCGSCWAFSAVQAAESAYFISKGKLYSYSEQNLVDCVTGCDGCNGGLMTEAYDYVIKNQDGKFMSEKDYPYKAKDQKCKFDASKAIGKITKYINVQSGSEKDLATKVSKYGPAAIAIDASNWSFQLYSSGIYDEPSCSSSNLDHGVGCVGYGSEGSTAYWIVRNSWGKSWGEKGYIRMVKDKNNQCGEATMACIPIA
jgi:cathepsin L